MKAVNLVELDSIFQEFGKGDQLLILSKRERTQQGQMFQITWESQIDPSLAIKITRTADTTIVQGSTASNRMTVLPYDDIVTSELGPFLKKHGSCFGP